MSNTDESFGFLVLGLSLSLGMGTILLSALLSVSEIGTGPLTLLIIYPVSVCVIAVSAGAYGMRHGKKERQWRKSRLAAMTMAWAPGKGHDYLGRPKEGYKFLIPLVVGFVIVVMAPLTNDRDLIFYGTLFVLFSVTWSCVDVNRICDEMGLPYSQSYTGYELEMHFKRSDVLEVLLFFLMGGLMVSIGPVFLTDLMTDPMPDKDYILFFDCIAPIFPIAITAKYAILRHRKRKGRGDS